MTEFEQYMSGFSLLSKEEWKTVRSRITVQELSKGTLLEKSGKVCHHYYFIQKGAVRTFSYLDTKEITIRFSFENLLVFQPTIYVFQILCLKVLLGME